MDDLSRNWDIQILLNLSFLSIPRIQVMTTLDVITEGAS